MTLCSITDFLPNGLETYQGVCDTHGAFSSTRKVGSEFNECPKCLDSQQRKQNTEEARLRKLQYLTRIADIPKRFSAAGLKNFKTPTAGHKTAKETAGVYFKSLRKGGLTWFPLVITGPVGTGKSHLACAIANNAIDLLMRVKYTSVASILADIRSAYGSSDGKTETGQVNKYINDFDLLIIDEVDMMIRSENDLSLLFLVINGRYNNLSPVIIVSNQAPDRDSLAKLIGMRVADRIMENATFISCNWESSRGGKL